MTIRGAILAMLLASAPLAGPIQARSGGKAAKHDLSIFVGRWQLDPARTRMGRSGPDGKDIIRSDRFTFAFRTAQEGLRMDVYAAFPQPEPTRSMPLIADGKKRVCAGPAPCLTNGGSPADQSFTWTEVDPHMLTRILYVKGAAYDYSTLSVSSDGTTMTLLSWAPATPQYMNLQVFTKQP